MYSYPLFLPQIHDENTYLKCLKKTNYFNLTDDNIIDTGVNLTHFTICIMQNLISVYYLLITFRVNVVV